jgi:ribosomal protein S18 acetylase RimI-like enzyme
MEIIIANKEHLDDLVSLNIEVQKLHVGFEPTIFKEPDREEIKQFFREILADENREIFISQDEARPVGYIALQIGGHEGHAFCHPQKWIYIDQIGVTKEFRGKGVGKKLIEAAKEYARKHNINHIMLDVWTVNKNAKVFFEKQGFTTFNERMRIEL